MYAWQHMSTILGMQSVIVFRLCPLYTYEAVKGSSRVLSQWSSSCYCCSVQFSKGKPSLGEAVSWRAHGAERILTAQQALYEEFLLTYMNGVLESMNIHRRFLVPTLMLLFCLSILGVSGFLSLKMTHAASPKAATPPASTTSIFERTVGLTALQSQGCTAAKG